MYAWVAMLLPYRTDTPIYHWPYATVGLIFVNTVVFLLCLSGHIDEQSLVLPWGSIDIWQWVTSIFAHAGFLHLIGNMIVLWTFGIIVEGKVGVLRFLLIYFAICLTSCALEQVLMLGAAEGGSLGASGVIFGLMGIAMIWAPKNHVEVFYWVWFTLIGSFTMSIQGAVFLIVAIEFFFQLLFTSVGIYMTSMTLHLLGAALGVVLGIYLVRSGRVDCEGWDWFSVHSRIA